MAKQCPQQKHLLRDCRLQRKVSTQARICLSPLGHKALRHAFVKLVGPPISTQEHLGCAFHRLTKLLYTAHESSPVAMPFVPRQVSSSSLVLSSSFQTPFANKCASLYAAFPLTQQTQFQSHASVYLLQAWISLLSVS